MDASTLVTAIASDDAWLHSTTTWLFIASIGGLVGVVIELWPATSQLMREHWDRDLLMEVIGGAIVSVAIIGEVIFTFMITDAETKSHADNTKYIALLESKTTEANRDAASAVTHAADIEAAASWRMISPPLRAQLLASLSKGSGSITIEYVEVDPEAAFLATQIAKLFDAANAQHGTSWDVKLVPRIYSDQVVFGLHVPNRGNKASAVLRTTFAEAGKLGYSPDDVPDTGISIGGMRIAPITIQTDAVIIIGSRPPPPA